MLSARKFVVSTLTGVAQMNQTEEVENTSNKEVIDNKDSKELQENKEKQKKQENKENQTEKGDAALTETPSPAADTISYLYVAFIVLDLLIAHLNFNCDSHSYRAKNGESLDFDVSTESCTPFGFYHNERVNTPLGHATGMLLS